jgi:bidirectional [NiFe] hydrogenase diaphorase subunit
MMKKDISIAHPSGDDRYKMIDRTIKHFNCEKSALLEVLTSAQEAFGFLSEDLLIYVSQQLNVPLSRVYGVATFYHMFSFEPLGEHNITVCAGTACYVKGSEKIEQAIGDAFNIKPGETTADGVVSLTRARCLGSCGIAPVVILNGEIRGKEGPDAVSARVKEAISRAGSKQKA